jgi:hypothetical protein
MSRHLLDGRATSPPERMMIVTANLQSDRRDDEFVYAHAQYAARREIAYNLTAEQLHSHGLFSGDQHLTPITPAALRACREQWQPRHWTGHGGWNWDERARRYVRKPRSFHAAAWSGQTLCGLCVGSVCRSKAHMIIQFMESAPDPDHPLRGSITEAMFGAAQNYARVLGIAKIYLGEPLPGLRERYESLAFLLPAPTVEGYITSCKPSR